MYKVQSLKSLITINAPLMVRMFVLIHPAKLGTLVTR